MELLRCQRIEKTQNIVFFFLHRNILRLNGDNNVKEKLQRWLDIPRNIYAKYVFCKIKSSTNTISCFTLQMGF